MKNLSPFLALLLVSATASAQDVRDCTEFYVYVTYASVPQQNPKGAAWDDGSGPDVEILAKPAGRKDLSFVTIGPKRQDATSTDVFWNSAQPTEARGVWLPVRAGDSIEVKLLDRDAMADDTIGIAEIQVPKEMNGQGSSFEIALVGGGQVHLGISSFDAKRVCKGLSGAPRPNRVTVPYPFRALVENSMFNSLFTKLNCAASQTSPICQKERHGAAYRENGTTIQVESESLDKLSDMRVYGIWSTSASGAKELFVGNCTFLGDFPDGANYRHCSRTEGDPGVVVDLGKGTSRVATEADLARIQRNSAQMQAAIAAQYGAGQASAPAPSGPSHCKSTERTLFTCTMAESKKILSLCDDHGLRYRFGKIAKVELEYPAGAEPGAFEFSADQQAIGNNGWDNKINLEFQAAGATFSVYWVDMRMGGMGADSANNAAQSSAGVRVLTKNGKTADLPCGPGWSWPDDVALKTSAQTH